MAQSWSVWDEMTSRAMAKAQIWTLVNMVSCCFLSFVGIQWSVVDERSSWPFYREYCLSIEVSPTDHEGIFLPGERTVPAPKPTCWHTRRSSPATVFSTASLELHITGLATVSAVAWIFFVLSEIHVEVQYPLWRIEIGNSIWSWYFSVGSLGGN